MSEDNIIVNDNKSATVLYAAEANFLKSVDILVSKLELALDNDMEIKPYKLRQLINDVKYTKSIMLKKE